MKSPTQRSLEWLRKQGYTCAIVEKWNMHAKIRQDLFGIGDVLAIKRDETLLVQSTSSGVSERVKKITEHENTPRIREAGWRIHIHGWTKRANGKYALRVEDLS